MEELGSSILKYYEVIKGLTLIILLFIFALYFYLKAGSSYSIMSRFWNLAIGKKEFNNIHLKELMQEREDIDKFNFVFSIKADSIEQIQRLKKRVTKQSLDIRLISRSKGYFYINTCKLKVPKAKHLAVIILLSLFFFISTIPLMQIAIKPAALIKFNDSDSWVWINYEYAEKYTPAIPLMNFFEHRWKFNKDTCLTNKSSIEKLSSLSKLPTERVKSICELFKEAKKPPILNHIIKEQKFLYFLSFISFTLSILALREFSRMLCSYDLLYTLLRKRGKLRHNYKFKYTGR